MAEIQLQQQQGDASETKKKSVKRKLGTGSIEIAEHDEGQVWVELEVPEYDRVSGKRTSIPRVQSFYPQEFERMSNQGAFDAMEVEILHAPKGVDTKVKKDVAKEPGEKVTEPKIVSDPGAGTPLVKLLDAKTEAQLREVHASLYPDVDNKELKKAELYQDIVDRVGEYSDPAGKSAELKAQHENQLKGLGLI